MSSGSHRAGPSRPKFPELPPKYSSSRELRNKAEKLRRDRLNVYIDELKRLLPQISTTETSHGAQGLQKKQDTTRTTILRLSSNFLKLSKLFSDAKGNEAFSHGESFESRKSHLENLGGYFALISEDLRLLYISNNVSNHIGHSQSDLLGHSLLQFTHPDDHEKLRHMLSRKRSRLTENSTVPNGPRISFHIRIAERRVSKNDPVKYNYMNVMGKYRRCPSGYTRRERQEIAEAFPVVPILDETSYMFLAMVRPVKDRPITELSLMEAVQDQYITRNLPDGRIIYVDHRISTITGWLPSDVIGTSAFNYIYGGDLPWTTMASRHMFASSNGEGNTSFRLRCKSGQQVFLQTRGFLEFNKQTNKVESFMCINTLLSETDGHKQLEDQKGRFTPFITQYQMELMKNGKCNAIEMLKWMTGTPAESLASSCKEEPASNADDNLEEPMSPPLPSSASAYGDELNSPAGMLQPSLSRIFELEDEHPQPPTRKRKFSESISSPMASEEPLYEKKQYDIRSDPEHELIDGQRVINVTENTGLMKNSLSQVGIKQQAYLRHLEDQDGNGRVSSAKSSDSRSQLNAPSDLRSTIDALNDPLARQEFVLQELRNTIRQAQGPCAKELWKCTDEDRTPNESPLNPDPPLPANNGSATSPVMASKEASSDLPELSNTLADVLSSADSSQSGYMRPERTLEQLENDAYRNQILDALINQSQLNNP